MPAATVSSRLEDTSAILGEYMLKGWTLTDLHCDACKVTPLMREPATTAASAGRPPVQFCALCDGNPARAAPVATSASTATQASSSRTAPPPPVARSEADDAAASISTLLLQGYSLLGENCPNASCKGMPLVGYPRKKDGSRDSRKMCVSCGSRWVPEGDVEGIEGMKVVSQVGSRDRAPESPRSRKRRELYEQGEKIVSAQTAAAEAGKAKGKERAHERDLSMEDEDMELEGPPVRSHVVRNLEAASDDTRIGSSLSGASRSLALTLDRLSASLSSHTTSTDESDEARYFVDVKLHTEAMRDVLEVLGMVEKFKQ